MGSSRKKRLLFIVEGESTERELILAAMDAFGISSEGFAILLYRTNIHVLINEIAGEDGEFEDDFGNIEIREVLAQMIESGKGNIGEVDYHNLTEHTAGNADWLRTASITDVFLLFDFDPQAPKYRPERLRAFQEAFTDSTGCLGKLLLSYPMIEAYRDASAHPFDEFCALYAHQPLSGYKKAVSDRLSKEGMGKYRGINAYDRETFTRGMASSTARACRLVSGRSEQACFNEVLRNDLSLQCDKVDLVRLLIAQQQMYERYQVVAVLCTALFFLSIWPTKVDQAWTSCKSMNMA